MMDVFSVVIPVTGELKKDAASKHWVRSDQREFYAVRFWLNFRKRSMGGLPKMGRIYLNLGTADGVETRTLHSLEFSSKIRDFETTFEEFFRNSEELSGVSAKMATTIGNSALIQGKANISSEISESIQEGFTKKYGLSKIREETLEHKTQVEYKIYANQTKKYIVPLMYEHLCFDVYVGKIDYLFVSYEKNRLQYRYRRTKRPAPPNANSRKQHENVRVLNEPLCCIEFYELLHSTAVIEEEKYKLEIEHPDEVIVGPPRRRDRKVLVFPDNIPTLYQITEDAFPKKWTDDLAGVAA